MRNKLLHCVLPLFLFFRANAQDFLGISTGNYAGITGVMLQPASIVDSRYKFDINLFSTGNNFSNNYLQVDRSALLKFNSNNFSDYKTFKSKYLSETSLAANEKAWFDVNSRIQSPLSFMATISKKSAIALNMQSRSMVQARNIPANLARMAYNEFYFPPLNNQVINASGFSLNTLNWIDIGLTYGHVLLSTPKHFLKGAFTAKYLGGVASLYMGSNNLALSVNNDSSVNFSTSRFEYSRNSKADFNIFDRNLQPDASAFGFNAGLVYEFRGGIEKLKFKNPADQKSYDAERRDLNKYLFKVGVSLLDAGVFNFEKAASVNNFSGTATNWHLNRANYESINQFDTALANRTTAFANDPRSYKVHMPTALSVQLDFRLLKGVYLNAMAYRPIKLNNSDGYRFDNYGYYAITPRWEGRHFGLYIPYTYVNRKNSINHQQHFLGATIRLGPLFIGSSNLGTMLFNKTLKAADVHAGIKIGITYGKSTKASRLIEKLTAKEPVKDTVASIITVSPAPVIKKDTIKVDKEVVSQFPLLVDYSNGKVYADPSGKGNIIIINNNNNYFYNNTVGKDSVLRERIVVRVNSDTVIVRADSTIKKKAMVDYKTDSLRKVRQDSIILKKAQLDSLIKRLEILRVEMDNSSSMVEKIDTLPTTASKNKIFTDNITLAPIPFDTLAPVKKMELPVGVKMATVAPKVDSPTTALKDTTSSIKKKTA